MYKFAVNVLDFFQGTFLKNINDFPLQKGRRLDGQRPVRGDIDLDVNITEIAFAVLRFAYTYKEYSHSSTVSNKKEYLVKEIHEQRSTSGKQISVKLLPKEFYYLILNYYLNISTNNSLNKTIQSSVIKRTNQLKHNTFTLLVQVTILCRKYPVCKQRNKIFAVHRAQRCRHRPLTSSHRSMDVRDREAPFSDPG